jgi:protoporphyrin/coproporphyrin ferrochelatase
VTPSIGAAAALAGTAGAPVGVLLMTYGSPADLEDVPRYLVAVRGGRAPEPELVTEFTRRYRAIGGSPLVSITEEQAAALEARLGDGYRVAAGMRFSDPTIAAALGDLARRGCRRVVGIVLSPQYSDLIMGGYGRAIDAAREELGPDAPEVRIAGSWHLEPAFIAALAARIGEAIDRFPAEERDAVPVLLTAHSLPRRVADQEPGYLGQLDETATAVARAAGLDRSRWHFCWQSAGHEPGEWMKPDFADLVPKLRREGHRAVVVAPVQFLADHLETLYDVAIGAREQADAAGMGFEQVRALNADPGLIAALAGVVRATESAAWPARAAAGAGA